jgi:hypothetical protein
MLITYSALLVRKLEYILDRPLTPVEHRYFTRKIKVGNNHEIKTAAAHLKLANTFEPMSAIFKAHAQKNDLSKVSKEELIRVVEDVVVKTASVQSGLKILRKADSMSREVLLQYVYDLYLKDAMDRDYRPHKYANHEAITNDQSNRPPTVENAYMIGAFENVDKNDSLTDVKTYDIKDEYLRDEFRQTPDHNGIKKPQTIKDKLKQYLRPPVGKPTGAPVDKGNQQ